jgi:hypothetical protein
VVSSTCSEGCPGRHASGASPSSGAWPASASGTGTSPARFQPPGETVSQCQSSCTCSAALGSSKITSAASCPLAASGTTAVGVRWGPNEPTGCDQL